MLVEEYVAYLHRLAGTQTDTELANKLEIHPSTFTHLRMRTRNLSAGTILAIHEKLGVPVAMIRQWEEANKLNIKGE